MADPEPPIDSLDPTSPEAVEAHLVNLAEERAKRELKVPRIELRRLVDYAGDIVAQSSIPSLDYGIASLNRLAPIPMRSMGTLMGPTGAGKTALAMTLAAHRTHYQGKPGANQGPSVHFLMELTEPQLAARRAAQLGRFSWQQVLGGAMTRAEIEETLAGENLFVVKPPRGVDFVDYAKRVLDEVGKVTEGTPLAVVDYLQRIKGKGRDLRESVSNVVDDLVDLTESRDMYTILLSKGSRAGSRAMRAGGRGEQLVDAAAESSAIEAGSSVVLAITYENRDGGNETDVSLEIAKGRFGATGARIGMRFHGASGRWEELDEAPLSKADRAAEGDLFAVLRGKPEGFVNRTALVKAAGLNKAQGLATLRRLIVPGGPIEERDGILFMRGN